MHISTVFLNTYSPNELIDGYCEVEHESTKMKIQFNETDRHTIQQICVNAYHAHKQKVIDALVANSPAYVGLPPPAPEPEADEAEFTELHDDIPF